MFRKSGNDLSTVTSLDVDPDYLNSIISYYLKNFNYYLKHFYFIFNNYFISINFN